MWVAHDLASRLLIDIRMRVYDRVERTAPGGLLDRRTGDLANGALSDVEMLEWFYAHTVGNRRRAGAGGLIGGRSTKDWLADLREEHWIADQDPRWSLPD